MEATKVKGGSDTTKASWVVEGGGERRLGAKGLEEKETKRQRR